MIHFLNHLHKLGFARLLTVIISIVYFFKGYGFVKCKFHRDFNSYEIKISDQVFLAPGPGWAYSKIYLAKLLNDGFCFYYKPKVGDCVIDLGAGLGEETIVFAGLVGDTGRVFSVEASPRVFKALKFVCDSNKFNSVTPINVALYEEDCIVDIEDNSENYLVNTIIDHKENGTLKVRGVTLDTLVKENSLNKIDFLKVNIEGAEQFLVTGSHYSLGLIENACISCHDFRHVYNGDSDFYVTKEKVKSFFEDNGFEVMERKEGNVVVDDYLYAKRKRLL
jgi:FkbM family methyltransferase